MTTDLAGEELPLLSIITPCLNRVDFVAAAVQSVLGQDYHNIEHIVIDGGSTDGTLDVLKHFPHLQVISEVDRGIYDAINKGIKIARGQVIGLLNTDDFYEAGVFSAISDRFMKSPEIMALVGGADIFKESPQGKWEVLKSYSPISPDRFWQRITVGAPAINAWFFRRTVFEQLGLFDIQYRIAADRDFILRFALRGLKFAPIDQMVYHYRQHPGSITMDGIRDSEDDSVYETRRLIQYYLSNTDDSPEIHRYLLTWQSEILAGQVLGAIRSYRPKRAVEYAFYGWRQDISWPYIFLRKISHALINRL